VGWFTRDAALFETVGRVLLADDAPAPAPGRLLIARDAFAHALPETALALRAALTPIAQRLGSVAEVTLAEEGLASWMQDFRLIQGSEIWATHRDWIGSLKPGFGGGIRERFDWVSTLTDDQVAPARRRRGDIAARLHTLLADGAVLAIPTVIGIAPLCTTSVAELEAWRNRCIGLLCIAGHAGLPQLSLPLAVVDGCPVGLSLIAAPGRDSMLLALARELMG
jgi:amidase